MKTISIFAFVVFLLFGFTIPNLVSAEVIIITKTLPDLKGDSWPREYSDVNHLLFDFPDSMFIHVGKNDVLIHPTVTRKLNTVRGKPFIDKAWVNIIDLKGKRYFAGKLDKWFKLDSADSIRIRDGFDSCYVYFKSCVRPGAQDDSCKVERTTLFDSLGIGDIDYIVFSSFDFPRKTGRDILSKSKYYYRKVLGFLTQEIPIETYLDILPSDAKRLPVKCDCMPYFTAGSVRKVIYMDAQSQ